MENKIKMTLDITGVKEGLEEIKTAAEEATAAIVRLNVAIGKVAAGATTDEMAEQFARRLWNSTRQRLSVISE